MQLISVATQLAISFMVLVLRWPSDPGEKLLRRVAPSFRRPTENFEIHR